MVTKTLTSAVMRVLEDSGPMSSSGLAIELRCAHTEVERALTTHRELFTVVDGTVPRWQLKDAQDFSDRLGLRRVLHPWQVRALQMWIAQARTGLVSAVTGAGKTEVGLSAIAHARSRGLRSLIVVPTERLAAHWSAAVSEVFPGVEYGMVVDDCALRTDASLVIIQSTRLGPDAPVAMGPHALAVVDEVQRLGAIDVSRLTSLVGDFQECLGLTSSLYWRDSPTLPGVPPIFDAEIVGCTYRQAVDQGIILPAKVVTTGVSFTGNERDEYTFAKNSAAAAEQKMRDLAVDMSGGVYSTACQLASDVDHGQVSVYAKEYIRADRMRTQVLSTCQEKVDLLGKLYSGLAGRPRVQALTFTEDDSTAIRSSNAAGSLGLTASAILVNQPSHGVIERFESSDIDVLSVSRFSRLDADLPAAGVSFFLSPAQDDDEMMRRLGRVSVPAGAARAGLVVVVYVNGTIEDPSVGGSAGASLLHEFSADIVDCDSDGAVELIRQWAGSNSSEYSSAPDSGDRPILASSDDWSIEDAILDVFSEYGGIALWDELRDVLPDIEAEDMLQKGISQVNWIQIDGRLVGVGSHSAERTDRVKALFVLQRAMEEFSARGVSTHELSEAVEASTILGDLRLPRLRAIWIQLGGRFVDAPATRDEKGDDSDPGRSVIVDAVEDSREVAALRVAVAARGGKVKRLGLEFGVVGRDGVQRTASVAGVSAHNEVHSNGVRILVDVTKSAPEFFLFNSSRDGRDESVESITTEQWASANGAWYKVQLGGGDRGRLREEVSDTRTEKCTVRRVSPSLAREAESEAGADRGADVDDKRFSAGDVEVRLKGVKGEVRAVLDRRSGEVTLTEVAGRPKLVRRKFRNAAVAAATVVSSLSGRTVFSAGYDDWAIVGDKPISLAECLQSSG